MLRLFYRVVLALVTILVCAGIARPAGGSAAFFVAAVTVATTDTVGAVQSEEPPSYLQDDESRPVVDMKAVESDVDDDDPLCDVSDDAAPALRCVAVPSEPKRARRGEPSRDPSRFASDACLPRGPPAA